ncbi:MAG TPA: M15 family metallopeptidase [Acidimicrobiia bacterium]|nr:M15 family metallopeptidase [Acidimicrobiia bacterium]
MGTRRPPDRRLPTHIYVRRRIAVGVGVILAVVLATTLIGRLFGAGGDALLDTTTLATPTTTTIPAPPPCTTGDLVISEDPATAWATVVVDTARRLPATYAPDDLVPAADAGFAVGEGVLVRSFLIADLRALRQAAADNGTPVTMLAAYRSFDQQQQILDLRIAEFGEDEALRRAARAGHSEHQLGTTVDLTSEGLTDVDQAWGASPTGEWVATNAHRFGFIVTYPEGAEALTCYTYEPWHLRYVGRNLATEVTASGLTLREYLYAFHPPLGVTGPEG